MDSFVMVDPVVASQRWDSASVREGSALSLMRTDSSEMFSGMYHIDADALPTGRTDRLDVGWSPTSRRTPATPSRVLCNHPTTVETQVPRNPNESQNSSEPTCDSQRQCASSTSAMHESSSAMLHCSAVLSNRLGMQVAFASAARMKKVERMLGTATSVPVQTLHVVLKIQAPSIPTPPSPHASLSDCSESSSHTRCFQR